MIGSTIAKSIRSIFLLTLGLVLCAPLVGQGAWAATATLAWDPMTDASGAPLSNLGGFRLYYGEVSFKRSGAFLTPTEALTDPAVQTLLVPATSTSASIDVEPGKTYYFRLTAYDLSGYESGFNTDAAGNDEEVNYILVGTDGSLTTTRTIQAIPTPAGCDTVRVEFVDPDLDTDPNQKDTGQIQVQNLTTGELETITAQETGANTGIFRARIHTAPGSSSSKGDGIISVSGGDQIRVRYIDALTALGPQNNRDQLVHVVPLFGDLSGNGTIGALDASLILRLSVDPNASPTFEESLITDLDGDGGILPLDASLAQQFALGQITRFPIQTDISSAAPNDPINHPFLKPAALGIALGAPQPQTDGTVLVPLRLEQPEGVVSGLLDLALDRGVELLGVELGPDYSDFMVAKNDNPEDLRIGFAGAQPPQTPTGPLLLMRFRLPDRTDTTLRLRSVWLNGQPQTAPTAIELSSTDEPTESALLPNWPNPFNPTTAIAYTLAGETQVKLYIYNLAGQQVRTLVDLHQPAGRYRLAWDGRDDRGRDVSSGTYLLLLRAGSHLQSRKLMLLR